MGSQLNGPWKSKLWWGWLWVWATALVAPLASSCERGPIRGSGKLVERKQAIVPFQQLKVSGNFRVELTLQAEPQLTIQGDENVLEALDIRVVNDRLVVESARPFLTNIPIVVRAQTPTIVDIEADNLAYVEARAIASRELVINLGSAAQVVLNGSSDTLSVHGENAGRLNARDLTVRTAIVELNNAAQADICARQELDGKARHGATLTYHCNPLEVQRDVATGGRVVAGQ